MRRDNVLALLNFFVLLRESAGQVCAPCLLRACPPVPALGCEEGRVLARDPCGCCDQCSRLELELCGGKNWQLGYCAVGLTCAALNHTGAVTIPDIGVCKGLELSADGTKASCWVNHKLRQHEEQWKEDDCTFCQCVNGERHCTAMVCKQNCHNPVNIPGECCPFCEESSYETVSPLLCPPLKNCFLTGHECHFGFQQDHNGCLLCQCLHNGTCPKLSSYCNKQCPMGYEKDNYGCEVCVCNIPSECRALTCRKTCPYGYMRNKNGCEMCRCIKCSPFTCDKQCSYGYMQNRKGCNICLCKEHGVSTTAFTAVSSHCQTASGQHLKEGESWHDGCRDCYCHGGREMCVLISCPAPTCTNPVLRSHQCCPSCEEELGSGHPEGMDMVVCQTPGDELYLEGDTWNLDDCTHCTCRQGRVLCDTEVCPPVLCQTQTMAKGTCCHICQDVTTTSVPVITTTKRNAGDTAAVTEREPVITEHTIIPITDGTSLIESILTAVEVSLIYQSAAWILAALLMSIVILFIVAFLINKKKNCIQMSCYNAPKKTVILKKHVNKKSIVYAEPPKENEPQSMKNNCNITFSSSASSTNGENVQR